MLEIMLLEIYMTLSTLFNVDELQLNFEYFEIKNLLILIKQIQIQENNPKLKKMINPIHRSEK